MPKLWIGISLLFTQREVSLTSGNASSAYAANGQTNQLLFCFISSPPKKQKKGGGGGGWGGKEKMPVACYASVFLPGKEAGCLLAELSTAVCSSTYRQQGMRPVTVTDRFP